MIGASPDLRACHAIAEPHEPVDPVLEVVLTGCDHCHAQDADPLGMHRPMRLVPRGKTLTESCDACGHHRERVI
jgi:hypothetical protein